MKTNNARIPICILIISSLSAIAGVARGDVFVWSGTCTDGNWYTVCDSLTPCELGRNWLYNNWGRSACSPGQPVFPSIVDDIQVGDLASLQVSAADVRNVSISIGGQLQVGNGGHLTVHGNLLEVDGQLRLHYGGYAGQGTLTVVGDASLSGQGRIIADAAAIIDGAGPLHILAGQTIRGHGAILHVPIVNAGVVTCDVPGGVNALRTNPKSNAGIMQAANGGTLEIQVPVDQTSGGRIIADGGNVNLLTGAAITGGTTESTGTSKIDASFQSCTLADVHNLGDLRVGNGGLFVVNGSTLTNDGLLRVYYGGYAGDGTVRFDAPVSLVGSGAMELSGATLNGATFFHAATHTIRGGGGTINAGFDNHGVVRAEGAGGTITLQGDAKANRGDLTASASAHLNIATMVNQFDTGRILADGGTVHLNNGAVVNGGRLETVNGGAMYVDYQSVTMSEVTNHGNLHVGNGGLLALSGTSLTNNGLLRVYYGGYAGNGTVRFDAPIQLKGMGQVELSGAFISGSKFVQSAGHVIHGGDGTIHAAFENDGTIRSEGSAGTLNLWGDAKVNRGDLVVMPGAHLNIGTTITQTGAGRILADGGTVHLNNGTTIQGGALETTNGGTMLIDYQSIAMSDVTNRGDLRVGNGGLLALTGSMLTNDGVVTTYYSGWAGCGIIRLDANQRFDGNGVVRLDCAGINTAVGATLTNGPGHTITGGSAINTPLFNEGILAPGGGVGTLPINADFTQLATGHLHIELGGAGSSDVLAVGGAATLAGHLYVVPVNGCQPQPGQQFVVLTSSALSGEFATITGVGRYTAAYADNRVTITVVYSPADMNCDAAIGAADISAFITALIDPAAYPAQYPLCNVMNADLNGDGKLDGNDIQPFARILTNP